MGADSVGDARKWIGMLSAQVDCISLNSSVELFNSEAKSVRSLHVKLHVRQGSIGDEETAKKAVSEREVNSPERSSGNYC